jgi:hypothetical protein
MLKERRRNPLKDADRSNLKTSFEKEKRLQRQLTDTTQERDSQNNEYKILNEKAGPELSQKFRGLL